MSQPAAIIDIDGTLVDSNYQHAIAWYRAFRDHGVTPAVWRIHRHIGMGGDQLVDAVAGSDVEDELGDAIRESEKERFGELIDEVRPFEGADELIGSLADRGIPLVLASSAKEAEVGRYLDLLGAADRVDSYTTSADVEQTKPEPDLVAAAVEKSGVETAVMIGDSTWDIEAAQRAGLETVAVLTGGFSEAELRDAGAVAVFESVAALVARLDDTPLVTG